MQYNRDPNESGRQSMMRRRRTTITKGDARFDAMQLGDENDDMDDGGAQLFAQINTEEMKDNHFGGQRQEEPQHINIAGMSSTSSSSQQSQLPFGATSQLDKPSVNLNRMTTLVKPTSNSMMPTSTGPKLATSSSNDNPAFTITHNTTSNRMTIQEPKVSTSLGGSQDTQKSKDDQLKNLFANKTGSDLQSKPLAKQSDVNKPTPLPLNDHNKESHESSGVNGEKDKESTPKWDAQKGQNLADDKTHQSSFDQLLNPKSASSVEQSSSKRPHMSMQISSTSDMAKQLKTDIAKNRETLDVQKVLRAGKLDRIDSDENEDVQDERIDLNTYKPEMDELLPEDDPDNYLAKLEITYKEQLSKETSTKHQPLSQDVHQQQETMEDQGNDLKDDDNTQQDSHYMHDFYLTMHEDLIVRERQEEEAEKQKEKEEKLEEQREKLQLETLKPDSTFGKEEKIEESGLKLEEQGFRNMIKIIDWNERRHQYVAKQKLKQHSELSTALREQDNRERETGGSSNNLRIFTGLQTLNSITNKLVKERQFSQAKATSLAISDDLLFIGTSEGQVWMFDRENEDDYDSFSDKSKEFLGNAVTAIDIHSLRSEYAVIGYERGQLVLFDATEPKKSVKTIKDHHQNASIVDIKFCDWAGGKTFDRQDEFNGGAGASGEEDPKAWMFISIDSVGRVVLNTVQKKLFVMTSNKHIVIDPTKNIGQFTSNHFSTVASRFHSQMHGHGIYDDHSFFAIGSVDQVIIMDGRSSSHQVYKAISAPFPQCQSVAINWGHGMTPNHMDRPHSLLAIAWGPYIQIVVMIDHEDREDFLLYDGYYVLRNIRPTEANPRGSLSLRRTSIGEEETKSESSAVAIKNPLEVSLANPDLQIGVLQFISDSTILVVTQMADVRVVHTHSFLPQSLSKEKNLQDPIHVDKLLHTRGDLESGIFRVQNLLKSEFVRTFAQTVKFFSGRLSVLTEKNVQTCVHLTWQQSIYEFKRQVHDDLIQVFSRAISIYKGKVKGYRGLLDNSFLRENLLKAELKLLVKEIIQQVVEKTKQESDRIISETLNEAKPLMDREGDESKEEIKLYLQKLEQFEDEKRKKFETLIRIAIEFCVELRDCDFLFKDLFWLFQEEKIEKLFVQELEPFIMAGKLQDWELPNEVIQNHVIKYYKDPSRAEALEKIIVNLNLKRCPKTIVLEFIHFSEMHFLTTAVLFLYTQVFEKRDNTSCTTVLCSVFDLYKKANKKMRQDMINFPKPKTQQQSQSMLPGSAATSGSESSILQHVDITMLKDASYDSIDKLQIERSQTYLGYKILWILNLFINGKKFPSGKIRENMWRAYIHDILEFLTNQEYLKTLLSIDAETVFQMISVIFYPTNPEDREKEVFEEKKAEVKKKVGPYELVKMGREEEESQKDQTKEQEPSHWRFMQILDKYCIRQDTNENIRFQYFFFVANIVATSPAFVGYDQNCFLYVATQLLQHHKRYIEFVKKVYEMSVRADLIKKGEDPASYILQQSTSKDRERMMKRIVNKVENDIIVLLQKSEPINNFQMQDVIKHVELTNFNQVKKDILEKRGEYIKSLQMLLISEQTSNSEKFRWIQSIIQMLEEKAAKTGQVYDKNIYEGFKREVVNNFKTIVMINVQMAIEMVNTRFNGNHKEIIDQLGRDSNEQLIYIDALTDDPENPIQQTVKSHFSESTNPAEAKKCIELLKQHVKLCCINRPEGVVDLIKNKVLVKNSGYPIEECLQVCQEFKQHEAVFLLTKKLQKFFESISIGVKILREQIDYTKMMTELYFCKANNISIKFVMPKSKKVLAAEEAERQRQEEQARQAAIAAAAEIRARASVVPLLSKNGQLIDQKLRSASPENVDILIAKVHEKEKPLPETLAFYDSIYGRLLKICLNYSREVDQKHENTMWFLVVDALLDTLRPLYRQKYFAREYFNHRFYAFIEVLVKVHRNGFSKLLDHLVKPKGIKHIKYFQDVSEVIFKIFGDQHLENLVLENANNSIRKVNSDIFEQFSQLARAGFSCRHRTCGVCKRYVDSHLYEDLSSFQNFNSIDQLDSDSFDQDGEKKVDYSTQKLHVFACAHTFHISCLKSYYLKKVGNNPQARDEVLRMFKGAPEKLRCVTCNLKNLEVDEKSNNKRAGVSTNRPTTPTPQGGSMSNQNLQDTPTMDDEPQDDMIDQRSSFMNKHLNKLSRLMETFEKQQGSEGNKLTIKDFKRV